MKKYLVIIGLMLLLVMGGCITPAEETEDPTLLRIQERGRLIVGSDIPYGVMEFYDESGNTVGIDYDIAYEIADYLEVELEFRNVGWDLLFDDVKSGEIDLAIAAITITPERAEEMLFSIPYFNGGQILIVDEDNEEIQGVLDLSDKRIGVQLDSTSEIEAKKYVDENNLVLYLGYDFELVDEGMIYDLKSGEIDAIIIDYVAAIDIVNHEKELKIIGKPFTEEFYGIITAKENTVLIDEVNAVLRELKETGEMNEIINKWSG